MRQLRAMMKKELFEQLKTHRLVVMLLLFTLVGVLSPAFAKMTPVSYTHLTLPTILLV